MSPNYLNQDQSQLNPLEMANVKCEILMDLSKSFDCVRHDLLLAKLSAYGFSNEALLCYDLSNRQKTIN